MKSSLPRLIWNDLSFLSEENEHNACEEVPCQPCAGFYLNPEIEYDTEMMYSDRSIVWGKEKKEWGIRHICPSVTCHTFLSASRALAFLPSHVASFALAHYSLYL